jgi:hypothetical protein
LVGAESIGNVLFPNEKKPVVVESKRASIDETAAAAARVIADEAEYSRRAAERRISESLCSTVSDDRIVVPIDGLLTLRIFSVVFFSAVVCGLSRCCDRFV